MATLALRNSCTSTSTSTGTSTGTGTCMTSPWHASIVAGASTRSRLSWRDTPSIVRVLIIARHAAIRIVFLIAARLTRFFQEPQEVVLGGCRLHVHVDVAAPACQPRMCEVARLRRRRERHTRGTENVPPGIRLVLKACC